MESSGQPQREARHGGTKPGVFVAAQLFNSELGAVFDDDGKTAYAYMLHDEEIIADVWLYNSVATPAQPEWDEVQNAPFMNPQEFAGTGLYPRIISENEVEFRWQQPAGPETLYLELYLRGERFAKLVPGSQPGWSKLAIKDGPLALVLDGASSV